MSCGPSGRGGAGPAGTWAPTRSSTATSGVPTAASVLADSLGLLLSMSLCLSIPLTLNQSRGFSIGGNTCKLRKMAEESYSSIDESPDVKFR